MHRNISGNSILPTSGSTGNGLAFQGDPTTVFESDDENKVYYPLSINLKFD
ncbi:MAG: hypothetical protein LBR97_06645 [Dysgonamonadaceae bacterium]|jgi:hypothetical protein|nr:hypothetical protein [Dysgonamonadaceae bacterium]